MTSMLLDTLVQQQVTFFKFFSPATTAGIVSGNLPVDVTAATDMDVTGTTVCVLGWKIRYTGGQNRRCVM